MFTRSILVSAGLLALAMASSAAYAQSTDDNRLDDAWKAALEDQEGILTPQQNAALNNIA